MKTFEGAVYNGGEWMIVGLEGEIRGRLAVEGHLQVWNPRGLNVPAVMGERRRSRWLAYMNKGKKNKELRSAVGSGWVGVQITESLLEWRFFCLLCKTQIMESTRLIAVIILVFYIVLFL